MTYNYYAPVFAYIHMSNKLKMRVLERNASDGGVPYNFNPIWKSVETPVIGLARVR